MARSRQIKPEFFEDEGVGNWSLGARLLFIGMWTQADDVGNVVANPVFLKSRIFPYDEDVTAETIHGWLSECSVSTHVCLYEVGSERFAHIKNFGKHQTINRPGKWRNPEPPTGKLTEDSLRTHGALTEDSGMKSKSKSKSNGDSDSLRSSGLSPAQFFGKRMREESNTLGVLGQAFEHVFNASPDYPRLGKIAKDNGGPEAVYPRLFRIAASWQGMGNPHNYLDKALKSDVAPEKTDAEKLRDWGVVDGD